MLSDQAVGIELLDYAPTNTLKKTTPNKIDIDKYIFSAGDKFDPSRDAHELVSAQLSHAAIESHNTCSYGLPICPPCRVSS